MVAQFMKTVVFYVNAFAWTKGAYDILSPLTIVEGTVMDHDPNFRTMYGECS